MVVVTEQVGYRKASFPNLLRPPTGVLAAMNGPAPRSLARSLPYALAFFSSLCIMVLELVASRLVAWHVGSSLIVWTSVIGIILGGICLGNVLGGRLADRVDPGRAVGPLYALGAALTLACLWANSVVGKLPGLDALPWDLRTLIVVTLDFLVPATMLGMISPVVAKWAVEQAARSGSALGDVYSLGALGSIVGTFLAGFILIYEAPTSTIVGIVAAALAVLAAALIADLPALLLGLGSAGLLALGAVEPILGPEKTWPTLRTPGLTLGPVTLNALTLAGHATALALAVWGAWRLFQARRHVEAAAAPEFDQPEGHSRVRLGDLAVLAFLASLAFMALEMDAGRLVQRHLGSSIYGWTSVIGVLLAGLSLGNLIGGKVGDLVSEEKHASWLFLIASVFVLMILPLETQPTWLAKLLHDPHPDSNESFLHRAQEMEAFAWLRPSPWPYRVLAVVTAVFLLPAVAMGTVSPVVAKLAVERARRQKLTGTAIGQVYAWGMVGSILGTFLTGFVLIDLLGTKGLILVLGTLLALAATQLGTLWHACWAGVTLALCIFGFAPVSYFQNIGNNLGIRELSKQEENLVYWDESDYYYIKVTKSEDAEGEMRTLVLDNLIHGYFILNHPERLKYDYEHIYALVTYRVLQAKAKAAGLPEGQFLPPRTLFLGGGSYTFPRYLQKVYPGTACDVAEIDPAVTQANHAALGLPPNPPIHTTWGDARQYVERNKDKKQYDLIFGDAFNDFSVPWHLTTKEFNDKLAQMLAPDGVYMINIIDDYQTDENARQQGRAKAETEARDEAERRVRARKNYDTDDIAKARAEATPAPEAVKRAEDEAVADARRRGGFLGAWVNTAKLTFPYVYVFGNNDPPGTGGRETFVIAVSKQPLDLDDLGEREHDPEFFEHGALFQPKPYSLKHMEALKVRSRGIVLTDDYAPVENLLAPVAETRAKD
jgi:spermidine synthase/MFS family permease